MTVCISLIRKVFLLFSEKEKGYLDQNNWGYVRNDYHGRQAVDLEEEIGNSYLRWIFLEKSGYYLIQNPKTKKFLSSYEGSHCVNQREIDSYGINEYIKWTLIHFMLDDKPYVILKSLTTKQYLTAQNNKKYSPGQLNNEGYHMTSNEEINEEKACFDIYLKWKLIELTADQLKVGFF